MDMITQFRFEDQRVRIIDLESEIWFVAKDIAQSLDYVKNDKMLNLVELEDKRNINPHSLDNSNMEETFNTNTFKISIINESGLYACIFGSTKPDAKKFKRWITSEVLPSIRKTGKYEIATPRKAINFYSDRIMDLKNALAEHPNHWTVIEECSYLLLEVESFGYPINKYDLLDGSVGQRWAKHRSVLELTNDIISIPYEMSNRTIVQVKGYIYQELGQFKHWLKNIYTQKYLPKYLTSKYGTLATKTTSNAIL